MGDSGNVFSDRNARGKAWATRISLVVSVTLLGVKMLAYSLTRSQAVLSDALESIVNVVTAGVALWVIWYSTKPADEDHPYGHGKAEYFSAAFEGGLITFASVMIILEALRSYFSKQVPQNLTTGVVLVAAAGLVNLGLGLYLFRRGQMTGSVAIKASGAHVLSDFWTSLGVVVGLGLADLTGYLWLDPLIAVLIGLWLGYSGISVFKESVGGLMDREDLKLLKDLAQVFERRRLPGVIQLHHAKMIRSGGYHHIDTHIVMPENWDVRRVHQVINKFEAEVIEAYQFQGEMNFHVDPCGQAYCEVCDISDCAIRKAQFHERIPVSIEHLRSRVEPSEYRQARRP